MEHAFRWLERRRRVALAAVVGYLLVTIACHEYVNNAVLWIQARATKRVWGQIVTGLSLFALAFFLYRLYHLARTCNRRRELAVYAAVTATLAVTSYVTLFYANSEVVHFIQYGILALLVYPLIGRYLETILLTTLLGGLDEAVQYWIMKPTENIPLDFNDIVLNLIGAGFGVVLAFALVERPGRDPCTRSYTAARLLRSPALLSWVVVLLVGFAAYATGWLRVHADPARPHAVILRRELPPKTTWVRFDWGKVRYELMPGEGLLLLALLAALYAPMDLRRSPAAAPVATPLAAAVPAPDT